MFLRPARLPQSEFTGATCGPLRAALGTGGAGHTETRSWLDALWLNQVTEYQALCGGRRPSTRPCPGSLTASGWWVLTLRRAAPQGSRRMPAEGHWPRKRPHGVEGIAEAGVRRGRAGPGFAGRAMQ